MQNLTFFANISLKEFKGLDMSKKKEIYIMNGPYTLLGRKQLWWTNVTLFQKLKYWIASFN